MGCCFDEPEVDEPQMPNDSKVQIFNHNQIPPVSSLDLGNKYKDEGKKYFNSGNFAQATNAFQLALSNDPDSIVNYTNLALAQKALRKFQESISTITKMEAKAKPTTTNIPTIVKAKIIKARCQSILVKNFCLNQTSSTLTFPKSEKLIKESVKSLTDLLESQLYKQSAKALNAENYLNNSKNINAIFQSIKHKSEAVEKVIDYFSSRLQSKESQTYFRTLQMQKYVGKPEDILRQLDNIRLARQKQLLKDDEEQEQFTIDPITYDQFNVPILVKSGLTYEKQILVSHYSKNGLRDPITKQNLNEEFGVNNLTLATYISQTKRTNVIKKLKDIDL